jgi:basic membrane protein A
MKKLTIILLVFVVLMSACNKQGGQRKGEVFELALITDIGTIDDKSFNQGSWDGMARYAREKNISHKYYQPAEKSTDAYISTIALAIRGGAKLVVTPGFLFEAAIFAAQDRYPEVKFVLVDGTPNNGDYSNFISKTGDNVVGLHYAEDQAGFLAGYAAVKEGFRKLGYVGGMAVPPVVRYGYGFVQGAEYAAQELGLGAGAITINYHYTGHFDNTLEVQTLAASWYNSGIEVIFVAGGANGNSVMAAAEQVNKKVIGVDVDQSGESQTVISSAMKGLEASVYSAVSDYYAGTFKGGQDLTFSAANDGVGLPMGTSQFTNFKQSDYDAIFAKLVDGTIPRMENLAPDGSPSAVPVRISRITEIIK